MSEYKFPPTPMVELYRSLAVKCSVFATAFMTEIIEYAAREVYSRGA